MQSRHCWTYIVGIHNKKYSKTTLHWSPSQGIRLPSLWQHYPPYPPHTRTHTSPPMQMVSLTNYAKTTLHRSPISSMIKYFESAAVSFLHYGAHV
jgi:hypothetical protein